MAAPTPEAARLLAPAINDALIATTAEALSSEQGGDFRAWFVREAEVAAEAALVAIRDVIHQDGADAIRQALGLRMETCNCARPEHTWRVVGEWQDPPK